MSKVITTSIETRPVSFMLNGEVIAVAPDQVDMTLLNWLRQSQQLTGSKEGCAEGDCGACSVIISRKQNDGSISHDAANACILLLPMLDGLVVTTIEHIAGPEGVLHPVQDAMVNFHGSQCGFCTPGFVISMVAGWRQGMTWARQEIEDLIAGNLCRCTGYGPIIAAAESLSNAKRPQWEEARLQKEAAWLEAHQITSLKSGEDRSFIAPDDLEVLSKTIAENPHAQIIAGATDIGLWVTKKHQILPAFISVMRVPELQEITEDEDGFLIGCGVSHETAKIRLADAFPQLEELWRRFGSSQVRASGTVCGNLANGSPIGDLPPALLALGASLTLRHGDAERCVPLDKFYHDYMVNDLKDGEWVKAVYIPKLRADQHLMIHKISRRFDQDISAVMGAFCYQTKDGMITEARIGFGGMAAVPARALKTEAAMVGQKMGESFDAEMRDCINADFTPIDDVRASARYRLSVASALLARSVEDAPSYLAGRGIEALTINGVAE